MPFPFGSKCRAVPVLTDAPFGFLRIKVSVVAPVLLFETVNVPLKVGDVPNTKAPLPVSSVTAVIKFADDGVPRKVATPVPRPETPVEIGSPVPLVRVTADGVPRFGVVKTGEVAKTAKPVPVSSERRAASCAELENDDDSPSEEVAICVQVFPAPPMRSWF